MRKITSFFIVVSFLTQTILSDLALAQALPLSSPSVVTLTQPFTPTLVRGITLYPDNPLKFSFLIDPGQETLSDDDFHKESMKLIRYFLASLTTPEEDMWVNLSPTEKDRIIPPSFGATEMGRDLLAQDFILKQLTASLMNPEEKLGKEFWNSVYEKVNQQFGASEIPVDTFNKVWIVPDKAEVFIKDKTVVVVDSHLKVMMDEDYRGPQSTVYSPQQDKFSVDGRLSTVDKILKEIILPAIEKEVNEGKNFAALRQIQNAAILAAWYKKNLKESLLGKSYVDQDKVNGIESGEKNSAERIYTQYLEAFKKGAYDLIKEDYNPETQEVVNRKYVSGGAKIFDSAILSEARGDLAMNHREVLNYDVRPVEFVLKGSEGKVSPDAAMTQEEFQNTYGHSMEQLQAWGFTSDSIRRVVQGTAYQSGSVPIGLLSEEFYDQRAILKKELKEIFRRNVEHKSILIYEIGLGERPIEAEQLLDLLTAELKEFDPEGFQSWKIHLVGLDYVKVVLERARTKIQDLIDSVYKPQGFQIKLDIEQANAFFIDQLRVKKQNVSGSQPVDLIFNRCMHYANDAAYEGKIVSEEIFPRDDIGKERGMSMYLMIKNILNTFGEQGAVYVTEPLLRKAVVENQFQKVRHLVIPGAEVVEDGDFWGTGVYRLRDPLALRSLKEFLEGILKSSSDEAMTTYSPQDWKEIKYTLNAIQVLAWKIKLEIKEKLGDSFFSDVQAWLDSVPATQEEISRLSVEDQRAMIQAGTEIFVQKLDRMNELLDFVRSQVDMLYRPGNASKMNVFHVEKRRKLMADMRRDATYDLEDKLNKAFQAPEGEVGLNNLEIKFPDKRLLDFRSRINEWFMGRMSIYLEFLNHVEYPEEIPPALKKQMTGPPTNAREGRDFPEITYRYFLVPYLKALEDEEKRNKKGNGLGEPNAAMIANADAMILEFEKSGGLLEKILNERNVPEEAANFSHQAIASLLGTMEPIQREKVFNQIYKEAKNGDWGYLLGLGLAVRELEDKDTADTYAALLINAAYKGHTGAFWGIAFSLGSRVLSPMYREEINDILKTLYKFKMIYNNPSEGHEIRAGMSASERQKFDFFTDETDEIGLANQTSILNQANGFLAAAAPHMKDEIFPEIRKYLDGEMNKAIKDRSAEPFTIYGIGYALEKRGALNEPNILNGLKFFSQTDTKYHPFSYVALGIAGRFVDQNERQEIYEVLEDEYQATPNPLAVWAMAAMFEFLEEDQQAWIWEQLIEDAFQTSQPKTKSIALSALSMIYQAVKKQNGDQAMGSGEELSVYGLKRGFLNLEEQELKRRFSGYFKDHQISDSDAEALADTFVRMPPAQIALLLEWNVLDAEKKEGEEILQARDEIDVLTSSQLLKDDLLAERMRKLIQYYDEKPLNLNKRKHLRRLVPKAIIEEVQAKGVSDYFLMQILRSHFEILPKIDNAIKFVSLYKDRVAGQARAWAIALKYGLDDAPGWIGEAEQFVQDNAETVGSVSNAWDIVIRKGIQGARNFVKERTPRVHRRIDQEGISLARANREEIRSAKSRKTWTSPYVLEKGILLPEARAFKSVLKEYFEDNQISSEDAEMLSNTLARIKPAHMNRLVEWEVFEGDEGRMLLNAKKDPDQLKQLFQEYPVAEKMKTLLSYYDTEPFRTKKKFLLLRLIPKNVLDAIHERGMPAYMIHMSLRLRFELLAEIDKTFEYFALCKEHLGSKTKAWRFLIIKGFEEARRLIETAALVSNARTGTSDDAMTADEKKEAVTNLLKRILPQDEGIQSKINDVLAAEVVAILESEISNNKKIKNIGILLKSLGEIQQIGKLAGTVMKEWEALMPKKQSISAVKELKSMEQFREFAQSLAPAMEVYFKIFRPFLALNTKVLLPSVELDQIEKEVERLQIPVKKLMLEYFWTKILPVINPKGQDLRVYYPASGFDLVSVLLGTDATEIVMADKFEKVNNLPIFNIFDTIVEQVKALVGEGNFQVTAPQGNEPGFIEFSFPGVNKENKTRKVWFYQGVDVRRQEPAIFKDKPYDVLFMPEGFPEGVITYNFEDLMSPFANLSPKGHALILTRFRSSPERRYLENQLQRFMQSRIVGYASMTRAFEQVKSDLVLVQKDLAMRTDDRNAGALNTPPKVFSVDEIQRLAAQEGVWSEDTTSTFEDPFLNNKIIERRNVFDIPVWVTIFNNKGRLDLILSDTNSDYLDEFQGGGMTAELTKRDYQLKYVGYFNGQSIADPENDIDSYDLYFKIATREDLPIPENKNYVKSMSLFIHPLMQREGIGSSIFSWMHLYAIQNGIQWFSGSSSSNPNVLWMHWQNLVSETVRFERMVQPQAGIDFVPIAKENLLSEIGPIELATPATPDNLKGDVLGFLEFGPNLETLTFKDLERQEKKIEAQQSMRDGKEIQIFNLEISTELTLRIEVMDQLKITVLNVKTNEPLRVLFDRAYIRIQGLYKPLPKNANAAMRGDMEFVLGAVTEDRDLIEMMVTHLKNNDEDFAELKAQEILRTFLADGNLTKAVNDLAVFLTQGKPYSQKEFKRIWNVKFIAAWTLIHLKEDIQLYDEVSAHFINWKTDEELMDLVADITQRAFYFRADEIITEDDVFQTLQRVQSIFSTIQESLNIVGDSAMTAEEKITVMIDLLKESLPDEESIQSQINPALAGQIVEIAENGKSKSKRVDAIVPLLSQLGEIPKIGKLAGQIIDGFEALLAEGDENESDEVAAVSELEASYKFKEFAERLQPAMDTYIKDYASFMRAQLKVRHPHFSDSRISREVITFQIPLKEKKLNHLWSNFLPIINPEAKDLTVYYPASGFDLVGVLAATDATEIVMADRYRNINNLFGFPIIDAVLRQVEALVGKGNYQYATVGDSVNIQFSFADVNGLSKKRTVMLYAGVNVRESEPNIFQNKQYDILFMPESFPDEGSVYQVIHIKDPLKNLKVGGRAVISTRSQNVKERKMFEEAIKGIFKARILGFSTEHVASSKEAGELFLIEKDAAMTMNIPDQINIVLTKEGIYFNGAKYFERVYHDIFLFAFSSFRYSYVLETLAVRSLTGDSKYNPAETSIERLREELIVRRAQDYAKAVKDGKLESSAVILKSAQLNQALVKLGWSQDDFLNLVRRGQEIERQIFEERRDSQPHGSYQLTLNTGSKNVSVLGTSNVFASSESKIGERDSFLAENLMKGTPLWEEFKKMNGGNELTEIHLAGYEQTIIERFHNLLENIPVGQLIYLSIDLEHGVGQTTHIVIVDYSQRLREENMKRVREGKRFEDFILKGDIQYDDYLFSLVIQEKRNINDIYCELVSLGNSETKRELRNKGLMTNIFINLESILRKKFPKWTISALPYDASTDIFMKKFGSRRIVKNSPMVKGIILEGRDDAMSASKDLGGIDLNPNQNQLKESGASIDFKNFYSPATFTTEQLNVNGFVPVILNISPPVSLPLLLGIREENEPAEELVQASQG